MFKPDTIQMPSAVAQSAIAAALAYRESRKVGQVLIPSHVTLYALPDEKDNPFGLVLKVHGKGSKAVIVHVPKKERGLFDLDDEPEQARMVDAGEDWCLVYQTQLPPDVAALALNHAYRSQNPQ